MPVPDPLPVTHRFDGARLRAIRERKGWRREDVAVRVPCSVTQITSVELGYVVPNVNKIASLCAVYGCLLDDVIVPVGLEREVPA
jgi:transcriptional regulator with XRE-family HTH domain